MNLGVHKNSFYSWRIFRRFLFAVLFIGSTLTPTITAKATTQIDIPGPPGSGEFGKLVTALPNGNFVVADPSYDEGGLTDVGAVYQYDGATATLISSLYGSHTNDRLGNLEIIILTNGHYVVKSPDWDGGRGAATWCSAVTGCSGIVSAANSLVGSQADNRVGIQVVKLANGHYVVGSPDWGITTATNAGAVTWCNGITGCTGSPSVDNSLVGTRVNDGVGSGGGSGGGTAGLPNGYFVVDSPECDRGITVDAGAVSLGMRWGGTTEFLTNQNSVRGTVANGGSDMVWAYDHVNNQILVSRPADNIVTLFRWGTVYLPILQRN